MRAGQTADGLLSVSLALRDDMLALGMPAERTDCIVTGVDLARFAPRDRAAAKQALGIAGLLVASVGALIPLKGHDLLIDAVAGLPGVYLAIAGQGLEADRLAARIAALGCGERIRLCGPLPPDSIADLLAAALPPEDARRIAGPFTWAANSERLHRRLERLVARRRGT